MEARGYVLSISHSAIAESGDMYLKAFMRRQCNWKGAGAYCSQTASESVSATFMVEQVDQAYQELNKSLVAEGLAAITPDQVNCIVLEANLGKSGSIPANGRLAISLLMITQIFPNAKLMLYTGTEKFAEKCIKPAKQLLSKILSMQYLDKDIEQILNNIVYHDKGPILSEAVKEAKTRLKPGIASPTSSEGLASPLPCASPAARIFGAFPSGSPVAGSVLAAETPRPVACEAKSHCGAGEAADIVTVSERPITPGKQRPKNQVTASPLREAFGSKFNQLRIKTPDREGVSVKDPAGSPVLGTGVESPESGVPRVHRMHASLTAKLLFAETATDAKPSSVSLVV
jgi:hypothetical protein